ncbi:MAG TPA: GMC family oxidoreductase N-terminal domain-containing protein [Candidatus Limnocylindrales bacterium]|jgi:choline dehydrogenase|nr:GMC family oxidoreductase N-terminal domain-containing protein [Candidatus Limnocylindrales bacterium]
MPSNPARDRAAVIAAGTYDLIVVGGGSAGCVVAARASEDPQRRVLLIEDGPDPRPLPDVVADPKRQSELVLSSPYVRMYDVARSDGSSFPLLSGRIMGGGSSINNLAVVRPMAADFDAWRGFGGDAWSYDALLPVMRSIETDPDFAKDPIHGSHGPIRLHRGYRLDDPADPPVQALLEAAAALGLPRCDDLNVPEPYGVCASPYSLVDGKRQSTTVAYLDPARGRPNLTIRPDTAVTRVVLDERRAVGVEVRATDGSAARYDATEIVLAAGVFHSPQLLLLSGIGPLDELERHGIEPRVRLDGVGRGYQDHAVVYITFGGTSDLREDYVIPKVRLIAKSDPARAVPDLHIFMQPSIRMEGMPPLLPVSIRLLEHRSAGSVTLASADPTELPIVDPALLRDPGDVAAVRGGFDLVRRLVAQPALAAYYGPLLDPPDGIDPTEHILASHISYYHGVGTCRFGLDDDPAAVVDPQLRVRGVGGLRVADASVLPTVPHANTNLAAILVGEIAAGLLAGD